MPCPVEGSPLQKWFDRTVSIFSQMGDAAMLRIISDMFDEQARATERLDQAGLWKIH